MNSTIVKSKEAIRDYIFSRENSDVEDFKRLLTLNDTSFFCYLAAMNISQSYHFMLHHWLFMEITESEDFNADIIFSGNLLVDLMPMLRRCEISSLPNIKNFEKFFSETRKMQLLKNGPELIKSKSHSLNIQNYLDFILVCVNPYDSFIVNIQFRTRLVLCFNAIRVETRTDVDGGTKNLHYLMLLNVLFDFHNTLFEKEFHQNKNHTMDQRAEILFSPYYESTNL